MLLPWLVLLFVLAVAIWGLVHSLRQKAEIHREHKHEHDVTGRHHHHA
jgi:ABC-type nickel/cobalt efflux system permease component RcnA